MKNCIKYKYIKYNYFHLFEKCSGWVLIDRCGKHFNSVLNFLRDEHVALPNKTHEIAELLAEAKFYLISPLIEACQQALRLRQCKIEPQCCIPLVSTSADLSQLITSSSKVTNF
jgi:BTB/POZ domain-containing adapter for CUL3-mediated RhoA degradation protein